MKLKQRVCINITFVNSKAERVKAFKDKHPQVTHAELYLKGLEEYERREK